MITKAIEFTLRTAFILAIVTVVGQVRIGGRSLENRYHQVVNSERFQTTYWTLAFPVTWTMDQAGSLLKGERSSAQAR